MHVHKQMTTQKEEDCKEDWLLCLVALYTGGGKNDQCMIAVPYT